MTIATVQTSRQRMILLLFQGLFFITLFVMSLSFRSRSYGSSSVDWQVELRLAMIALMLAACLLLYKVWYKQVLRPDNLPLTLLVMFFLLSSFYAPSVPYSLGASVSVVVFVLLPFVSLPLLGIRRTMGLVIAVTTFTQILSIMVYFAIPEIGHTKVWVGAHQVLSSRMSGLSGANGVGAAASLAIFLIYFTYVSFGGWQGHRRYYLACLVINFVALIMCNSRTSLATMILGIGFSAFARRVTPARLGLVFLGAALLVLAASLIDFNSLFAAISRSGNAEEISTGTGRTLIWQKCTELANQKPFFGWGYASTSFILPQFKELGDGAPHCHDIYLQIAFCVGWLGPVLYISYVLIKFIQAIQRRDIFRMCLLLMGLIGGVMEAGAFAGVANISTFFMGRDRSQ